MTSEAARDENAADTTALVRQSATEIDFGTAAANWDHAFRIAKVIADADDMIPKQYRGQPAKIVMAMQTGAEVGLSPMMALQSIRAINGQFGLYGDGFLAVIMASPRYLRHQEYYVTGQGEQVEHLTAKDLEHDETMAVSKFWRKGDPEPKTGTFSIADAKRAHLLKKEGPWIEYPQRQLMWRARGFAGRNGFAAELRGLTIIAELEDMPLPDVREEPRVVSMPIRRSEKAAAASVDSQPIPSDNTDPVLTNELPLGASPEAARTTRATAAKPGKAKAGPVPVPPTATARPTDDRLQTVRSVVITETAYVTPKDEEPFWEVRARVEKEGEAPVAHVFSTRDQPLYELAATCEGTPQLFTITWQSGKRRDASPCKVLRSLAAE